MTTENDTPAADWREFGDKDPHGTKYQCRRSDLPYGDFTDDQIANAVFICDHRASLESIGLLEAAKARIRWLSRQNEAKAERIKELEQAAAKTETVLEGLRGDIESASNRINDADCLPKHKDASLEPLNHALSEIDAEIRILQEIGK